MAGARSTRTSTKQPGSSPLLSDRAFEAIRDKIVSLEIPPGAPIEEEQLAAELGVGRTPVREAIKRLAYRRLVVVYPRSGSFAADLHPADLEALCDMRERLEGLAAERAATEATYEERLELRELLDALEACTDQAKLLDLDVTVHRTVHRMAHNPYLHDILAQSLDLSLRMWNLANERLPDLDHHVHGQTGVLQAILDRDGERARTLAEAHVREFEDDIRKMF
ncbi:GntR family transcriptional regulator [Mycolicibacterium mageritense DSM 44476 = CIP 104973]|uniref:GntR family transcriptional regulator n=1 Tax=Mycolicibacterium mageritense TaxID=53462 RepID=A0AAI8XQ99_MYCME|nr:GntR family transcriptional regulator [Mycolicibacterium mageritense]MBN3459009.1 GntR family transcriptional regulator [Mycobacterium sp. DSM 3803]CDO19689.1 GntR family transcriptional regulator [Mycolicibacterium mageritense DSM 44476 = CIP 104973]BBX35806.1 GntR family transcriptional regulator [Mycolicibacterium mageritense]BDY30688.1 HTH-type transcriptional repressor RspR [Mycolicibacterium mageritense]GJJ17489.1 GntR family transcriptional regulator [Mycolicibacterium mageritense]